jgi:hypothetical protein
MAYMDQERKARLAAELKRVVPLGWKYTLAVRHHSTIVMTITEAPVDIVAALRKGRDNLGYTRVNKRFFEFEACDAAVQEPLIAVIDTLNTGNHDRSDSMTDYFDVGWYVEVNVGRWDKPFKVSAVSTDTAAFR